MFDIDLISVWFSGKNYWWVNFLWLFDLELIDLLVEVLIVVIWIFGGYCVWQSGIDMVIVGGVLVVLVSGEQVVDVELIDCFMVVVGIVLQVYIYLVYGGVDNLCELYVFLCDIVLMIGFGFMLLVVILIWGVLECLDVGKIGLMIVVFYYCVQYLVGNIGYVEVLCWVIEDVGGCLLLFYCVLLCIVELWLLERFGGVDVMVVIVLVVGGVKLVVVLVGGDDDSWNVEYLVVLDILIL